MSVQMGSAEGVATKNSESGGKSRVLGFAAVMSLACLCSCVPSSRLLPADSAVARFWNWRTSPCVISCTFFVASGRVGLGCLPSTACSGLALPDMAALSGRDGVGQAINGRPMAPSGLPPLLAMAFENRTTVSWIARFVI